MDSLNTQNCQDNLNSMNTTTVSQQTRQQNRLYATVTNTPTAQHFPKRDQAIVLNAIEELKLNDYVTRIGNIISPRSILFASRISNNRICIYLSETKHVDHIIQNFSTVEINSHIVTIRRLITPARRIILSNVSPCIPHELLESTIKTMGFTLMSPMSFLKAGITGEEYSHILSFRRQVYIQPDEEKILPPSLVVKFEGTSFRIFLTYDEMTCFACKQQGHIASQCPNTPQQTSAITQESTTEVTQQGSLNQTENLLDLSNVNTLTSYTTQQKRPAPSTIDTTPLDDLDSELSTSQKHVLMPPPTDTVFTLVQRKNKKPKKSHSLENLAVLNVREQISPVKTVIEEASPKFVLNFEQLSAFMENVHGTSDPLSIAHQYTEDIPALIDMLHRLYPYLSQRNIKYRFTKIKTKLQKCMNLEVTDGNTSGAETDTSQNSTY